MMTVRKIHRRVRFYGRFWWLDVQGRLPVGWCERCGAEVFARRPLCQRCERREFYG